MIGSDSHYGYLASAGTSPMNLDLIMKDRDVRGRCEARWEVAFFKDTIVATIQICLR